MNSLAKFVGFLTTALMLAAFALPASAAKTISLSVTPATLSAQTNQVVTAVIGNTGNSNANSFEIDWTTSPYFTVTSASVVGGGPGNCGAGQRPGYSGCTFLYQLPTKTSVTIKLNVQVTNQCAALSIDWFAYAWTGSPGAVSQAFTLAPGTYNTASTPNCTINFVTQPTDAFIGSTITGSPLNSGGAPVTVKLLRSGAPVVGATVNLSALPASCATGAGSATTDSAGVVKLQFTGAAAGPCALTASEPVHGSVNSQSFNVVQQTGNLGCTTGNNTFGTTGAGTLAVDGTRLENVTDPSNTAVGGNPAPACVVVPYVVSATCPAGVTGVACTNFVYDPLDQGTHMAFHFTWEWPIETIPEGGIDAIPETLQLFINGNSTPVELNLCPHTFAVYGVGGAFEKLIADPLNPGPFPFPQDQDGVAPGTQSGCLIGRNVIQKGSGLKLVEDAWVQGDYTTIRR